MMAHSQISSRTLVDEYLEEQRDLSAVARFARWHEHHHAEPSMARHYRALMPLADPRPGQQYGFEVDLDACSGCKACVTACHALNGLEDHESWRRVGLLVTSESAGAAPGRRGSNGQANRNALLQHVTTACHHCLEPACLHGCPVLAYDKDPATGIVRHLDDQCIGCTYCVMMCPYDVPQYSSRLGIVRKCDLCQGRLADGEAPACVQACPTEAIRVTLVSTKEIRRQFQPSPRSDSDPEDRPSFPGFLPSSPRPEFTLPTTRYLTNRVRIAQARAADENQVAPAPAHDSLVGFLLLSQLSVGLATLAALLPDTSPTGHRDGWTAALLAQCLALGVALLHLGQPLRAWRAFLGWRTSWFSREVIVFGGYSLLLGGMTLYGWADPPPRWLGIATAGAGHAGVFCSAMIYAATRRRFWALTPTVLRFHGTTLALGSPAILALSERLPFSALALSGWATLGLAATFAAEYLAEHGGFSLERRRLPKPPELHRTTRLLCASLNSWRRWRIAWCLMASLSLAALATSAPPAVASAVLAIVAVAAYYERRLFFTAVAPERMPGGVAA